MIRFVIVEFIDEKTMYIDLVNVHNRGKIKRDDDVSLRYIENIIPFFVVKRKTRRAQETALTIRYFRHNLAMLAAYYEGQVSTDSATINFTNSAFSKEKMFWIKIQNS